MNEPQVMQRVGDRDNPSVSVKDVAFTIPANPMSDRGQVVIEPQVLTPKRTEEGKRMRKDYEAHKASAQRKEMQQLEPREDGISNTLTTAQKDNYLMVPSNTAEGYVQCEVGGVLDISYPSSTTRRGRVQEGGGNRTNTYLRMRNYAC